MPKDDIQSQEFDLELRHRSFLHEGLINIFSAFPDGGHPMANLSSAVSALSTFYFDHKEMGDEDDYQTMARRIIAKITTLVASSYRNSVGIPFV